MTRFRRLWRRIPAADVQELAGVVLVAWALSFVHVGLAIGAVGVFLVVNANAPDDGEEGRR